MLVPGIDHYLWALNHFFSVIGLKYLKLKFVLEGGDTAHTFLMSGTNGVGTPHNIYRKSLAVGVGWGGGGWVVSVRE